MAIVNPFNHKDVVDLTSSINIIPNRWGLYEQLGLFTKEYKTQREVLVYRDHEEDVLMKDSNWDERNDTLTGGKRDAVALHIPHYNLTDAIYPNDLNGVADWDSVRAGGNGVTTLNKVRAQKMEALRKSQSLTIDRARAQLIREGTVYAPRGTVTYNFYDVFGEQRQDIDVELSSTTVNPNGVISDILGLAQDSLHAGDIVTNWVALCSEGFFKDLISNDFVNESYLYFNQPQGAGILNQRLDSGRFDARYREFNYAGITFIEARGSVGDYKYVEEGKAYLLPLGTDSFRTMFAPANRFGHVNTTAQESYFFEYHNKRDDVIDIMSETNFLNIMVRPQAVITLTAK